MFNVLLYYKYTKIEDPQKFRDDQYALCNRLGIKGRILIADEGINGTCSGTPEALEEYKIETEKTLGEIDWKLSTSEVEPFPRLRVVVRNEIVTLGLRSQNKDVDLTNTADYIEPEELLALYENNEDFVILDGRNEYEARVGKFKNALYFNVKNFRDIPEKLDEITDLKDKTIITYCTGGIRCEKFSALLKENGFNNVKQLHGGIAKYYEKTGGKNFDGKMYVFDNRVLVDVNDVNPNVISECKHCGTKIARYVNCQNALCNEQFICCEDCDVKMKGCCSDECKYKIENGLAVVSGNRKQSIEE